MEHNTELSEEIRELQDTVVTLRLNIPVFYKNLLLKECGLEHQQILDTDIRVAKQPFEKLDAIQRVQKQTFPNTAGAPDVQDVHSLLNVLHKLFPRKQ